MLKSNKATPSTIKFKSIPKVLRTVSNGYSTTKHIQAKSDVRSFMLCFSARSNHQLNPTKFISSIRHSKKQLDEEMPKPNESFSNYFPQEESLNFKTESQIYPITVDEGESIQNICLTENTEKSESGRHICLTELCDYPNDLHSNLSLLDTPTKIVQIDTFPRSDLISNINVFNLEKAANKLSSIIEKKSKRRRSFNKTNIDLATTKLASLIDRKKNVRRTCSGRPQAKLNRYINVLNEEKQLSKLKKLEDIMNKERKSAVPTSTPSPCPSFKEQTIQNRYFIHSSTDNSLDNDEGIKKMSLAYMLSFKDWKISKENYLLNQSVIDHLINLSIKEKIKPIKESNKVLVSNFTITSPPNVMQRGSLTANETAQTNISQWARRDISNEIAQAEQFKDSLNANMSSDQTKHELTSLLNALTVDNYSLIQSDLMSILSGSRLNQEKFVEVLLSKAITEKAFVKLYATLCKDLDKLLPFSSLSLKAKSTIRTKLIESCKSIFNLDLNTLTKSQDSYEQEQSIKRYIVGNVNFIGELINSRMVSKRIGLHCIEALFEKYNHPNQSKEIRLIQIEALVSFIDKFGSIIHQRLQSTPNSKRNDNKLVEELIQGYIALLGKEKEDISLPGYIKYKIINLEEKQKNSWKQTLFERTIQAKGKRDLVKELKTSNDSCLKQCFENNLSNGINQNKITVEKKEDPDTLQSALNLKLKNILKDWMTFLSEGNKRKNFNWKEIDILIAKQIPIKAIFLAYIESVIDTVVNETSLHQANDFFKIILQYYSPSFKDREIIDLKQTALDLLSNIVEMQMDNQYMSHIWGCIVYYFLEYKILFMKDFNHFLSFPTESLKGIFTAFKHTIHFTKAKERRQLNDFKQVRLIKENEELFDALI